MTRRLSPALSPASATEPVIEISVADSLLCFCAVSSVSPCRLASQISRHAGGHLGRGVEQLLNAMEQLACRVQQPAALGRALEQRTAVI